MRLHSRINVNRDESVSDGEAMRAVSRVVDEGLVSGDDDTYCYHTVFTNGVHVSARRTRAGNHTFWVYQEGESE